MHLLAATPGQIDDGQEPVDLQQNPADVVVISAADTELAALSAANAGASRAYIRCRSRDLESADFCFIDACCTKPFGWIRTTFCS